MLNFPIMRVGKVIHADRSLSADESDKVGEEIKSKATKFLSSIVSIYKSNNISNKDIDISSESVRYRDEGAPIIDFPYYRFKWKGYRCWNRVSVTVCKGFQSSKIWSRISLERLHGRNAFNISSEEARTYFTNIEPLLCNIVHSVFKEYEKVVIKLGIAKYLTEIYNFKIGGLNTSDKFLYDFFKLVSNDEMNSFSELLESPPHLAALSPLFAMPNQEGLSIEKVIQLLTQNNNWKINLLKNDILFNKYQSVYITHNAPTVSTINCFCYNNSDTIRNNKPADDATLSVLRMFAERY